MKGNEYSNLSRDELNEKIFDLKKELFNLRFQNAAGSLKNHQLIGKTKRDIARAKTALRSLEPKAQA